MDETRPIPEIKTEHFKFVNNSEDAKGSFNVVAELLKSVLGYADIGTTVLEVSLNVVSMPSVDEVDSRESYEEMTKLIDNLRKSSDELGLPITTARQIPVKVPTFEESVKSRTRILNIIRNADESDLDEALRVEISCLIRREFNRRMYGAGCMRRSKDEWDEWVNRVEELTTSLMNGDITLDLFRNRIKEESN